MRSEKPVATLKSEARDGLKDFLPLMLPVLAFGMMFGAASVAAGYSIGVSLWSSIAIFAGASQFVFLEVNRLGVPAWSVVLAVFAVNFRHILYSAAIGNKIGHFSFLQKFWEFFLLTDLQFANTENRHEKSGGNVPVSAAYYFGFGIASYVLWVVATFIGAVSGSFISDPASIGLDFVLPIYFLSILMGFRRRSNFILTVLVSASVAVLVSNTLGAPWHISLGALAGIGASIVATLLQRPDLPTEKVTALPLDLDVTGQRDE